MAHLSLDIPDDLKAQIIDLAVMQRRSITQTVIQAIETAVHVSAMPEKGSDGARKLRKMRQERRKAW